MNDWHIPEAIPARTYVDGHLVPPFSAATVRKAWITAIVYAALQAIGLIYTLAQAPTGTLRLVVQGVGELGGILLLAEGVRRWHFAAAVLLACDPFIETVWYFWMTGPQPDGRAADAYASPLPIAMIFLIPITVLLGRAAIEIRRVRQAIAALPKR